MDKQAELDFLKQLVAINTAGGHEQKVTDLLVKTFADHGIKTEKIKVEPGRYDLIAKEGNGHGPVLVLEGHQDTVNIGNLDEWKTDPLVLTQKGDRLYGRGATDMKSGLADEVLAFIALHDQKVQLNGTLEFMATVGEETSQHNHMQGAEELAKRHLIKDVDAMIIGEPTDGIINFAHKGSITYRVSSKGIRAHSSRPQMGFDAIAPLIHFYVLEAKYYKSIEKISNKYLGSTIPVISKIDGGDQLNAVADYAELFGKIRTIPEVSNDEIWKNLKALIKKVNDEDHAKLSLKVLGDKLPVVGDPNAPFIKTLHKVAEKDLGKPIIVKGVSGGTDASEFVKDNDHFSMAAFGPGNTSSHAINEWCSLKSYYDFINAYEDIAKAYLK